MRSYLLQIFFWAAYGVLHSVLAGTRTKHFFQQKMGKSFRYYRLIYNGIAFTLLVALWWYQRGLPAERLWIGYFWVDVLGSVSLFVGAIVAFLALKEYDLGEFLGLLFLKKQAPNQLKTSGMLHYVRHPLYTGTFLVVWGLFLKDATLKTLIMAICITIYTLIGIYFEEKKLISSFGDDYLAYRRRVPMLFPKIF